MARRSREDSEATRQSILDAAVELFLEQGVTRTSLAEIAAKAGHTRGAIYHHFENKGQIIEELIHSVCLPFDELFNEKNAQSLEQFHRQVLKTMQCNFADEKRKRIHTILFHRCEFTEDLNPVYEESIQKTKRRLDFTIDVFRRAQQRGEVAAHFDPAQLGFTLQSMCIGLYWQYLREPWKGNLHVDLELALALFFNGLKATQPSQLSLGETA